MELEKLDRRGPLKKFCEKLAVQKTLVGKEVRELSPIRQYMSETSARVKPSTPGRI